MINTTMATQVNQGRNVRRIREILDIKQEALAEKLGKGWNQQKVSALESKEEIEPGILDEVAKALGVTPEAIKNFSEEKAINFIASTFNNSGLFNYSCTLNFNPIDKVLELYERMIKEKDEQIEKLKEEKQAKK